MQLKTNLVDEYRTSKSYAIAFGLAFITLSVSLVIDLDYRIIYSVFGACIMILAELGYSYLFTRTLLRESARLWNLETELKTFDEQILKKLQAHLAERMLVQKVLDDIEKARAHNQLTMERLSAKKSEYDEIFKKAEERYAEAMKMIQEHNNSHSSTCIHMPGLPIETRMTMVAEAFNAIGITMLNENGEILSSYFSKDKATAPVVWSMDGCLMLMIKTYLNRGHFTLSSRELELLNKKSNMMGFNHLASNDSYRIMEFSLTDTSIVKKAEPTPQGLIPQAAIHAKMVVVDQNDNYFSLESKTE